MPFQGFMDLFEAVGLLMVAAVRFAHSSSLLVVGKETGPSFRGSAYYLGPVRQGRFSGGFHWVSSSISSLISFQLIPESLLTRLSFSFCLWYIKHPRTKKPRARVRREQKRKGIIIGPLLSLAVGERSAFYAGYNPESPP